MRLGIEYIENNITKVRMPIIRVFYEDEHEKYNNLIRMQVEKILEECLFLLKTSPEGMIKE